MEAFLKAVPQLLQLLLFLVMFGMGMTLKLEDFKRIGQYPRAVLIGLCNQIILLPIIGFILVSIMPISPVMAMGIMVVTACPGGATSNLMSHLSKGDTALSITLTAFSSLITIITIPLIINFSLSQIMAEGGKEIQLPVFNTILNIIKLTALPVAIGMFINHRFPDFSQRSRSAVAWGSGIVILSALSLMILKLDEYGSVWQFIKAAGPAVLLLNLITLAIGFISARLLKLGKPQSITISLEIGMQNNVLGMAIATAPALLNNPPMATPAGVYGIIMCITGTILIYFFRKL